MSLIHGKSDGNLKTFNEYVQLTGQDRAEMSVAAGLLLSRILNRLQYEQAVANKPLQIKQSEFIFQPDANRLVAECVMSEDVAGDGAYVVNGIGPVQFVRFADLMPAVA